MNYWLSIIALILLNLCLIAGLYFANSNYRTVEDENVDIHEAYYLKDVPVKQYFKERL